MGKVLKTVVIAMVVAGMISVLSGFYIPAKAIVAQHLLQRSWHQSLATGQIVKPWPWADTWPVGRLQNARLGVDLIILEGQSGEVLAFGPGHFTESGSPGEGDHCILAGHRDTSFAFLKELLPGDELVVEGNSGKEVFIVQAAGSVRAQDLYLDNEQPGMLTLITCFPFQAVMPNTPLRYVVTAMRG